MGVARPVVIIDIAVLLDMGVERPVVIIDIAVLLVSAWSRHGCCETNSVLYTGLKNGKIRRDSVD